MVTFNTLCLELFLLAQQGIGNTPGAVRGRVWEEVVAGQLARHGIPIESVPGGYRVLGFCSLSGLRHQVDATLSCANSIVLAEWKAYRGALPKNELLRFKAATDDYYMSFATSGLSRPVHRIFGGIGSATDELRRYAALHGIALIESERWPLPVLACPEFVWPSDLTAGPSLVDQRSLAWGVRPLQRVMRPQESGGFLYPRPGTPARLESLLRLHEYWSDQLWGAVDRKFGGPDAMLSHLRNWRGTA